MFMRGVRIGWVFKHTVQRDRMSRIGHGMGVALQVASGLAVRSLGMILFEHRFFPVMDIFCGNDRVSIL